MAGSSDEKHSSVSQRVSLNETESVCHEAPLFLGQLFTQRLLVYSCTE